MRKMLREPLLHFLLIGAVVFGVYAWLNPVQENKDAGRQVRIGESDVVWLKESWAKQWQREPTSDELRGLVTEFLKEELLAREAREMGLDQHDAFVRRRLAQKVEFIVQDTSRLSVPTEEDLRRFYNAHPMYFSEPAKVSFRHVYFSRKHRRDAAADAQAALTALNQASPEARPADLGDRLLLDLELSDVDQTTLTGMFGSKFAIAVLALPAGAWHGPIESGYGLHLVRVSAQTPARPREFEQVRAQVIERWQEQRQREVNERYFAGLLKKYDVSVDASLQPLVGALGQREVEQ